jgi:hypothetical protein
MLREIPFRDTIFQRSTFSPSVQSNSMADFSSPFNIGVVVSSQAYTGPQDTCECPRPSSFDTMSYSHEVINNTQVFSFVRYP